MDKKPAGGFDVSQGNVNTNPSPNIDITPAQISASERLGVDPKWVSSDGRVNWPENRGFDGEPAKVTIEPGTRFDRYGGYYDDDGQLVDTGKFVSPEGTPFNQRALPNSTLDKPYSRYEVVKPIPDVDSGKAAPWFDKPGGGTQMDLPMTIDELVEGGYIRVVD